MDSQPLTHHRGQAPTTCALVVSHDDPAAVDSCVSAVLAQTTPAANVLVIDTAGLRPADAATVADDPRIKFIRWEANVGPAGGWAVALASFLDTDCAFAWLLDDDCVPASDALERLIANARNAEVVQSRMVERNTGRDVATQGWCGVLVRREVVETVGVPDADLVWWTEDTEYLQWRIPREGFSVVRSADARVEVSLRPARTTKPAWKYYYEARNQVAYRLRTQRPEFGDRHIPRHLTRRVRWWRALRAVTKLSARSIVVERTGRIDKLRMVLYGTWHGLCGVTGLTVPLGEPDRARAASELRA